MLPFDETGKASTNRKEETHTVASINGVNHNFIMPEWKPFFKDGFAIFHVEGGRFLKEDIDFIFTHDFDVASEKLKTKVCSSITLLDKTINGNFKLVLQSLGGSFVTSETQAIKSGFDSLLDLKAVKWEDIITPAAFPLTSHDVASDEIEGVNRIIAELAKTNASIEKMFDSIKMEDITDLDTAYVAPLLTKLGDVAVAIKNHGFNKNLVAVESLAIKASTDINVGALTVNTWTDMPLDVMVAIAGTYQLDYNLNYVKDGSGKIETRFLIDNVVVSKSYLNNLHVTIPANKRVKVQARVVGAPTTYFKVAGDTYSSNLNLVRISN